MNQVKRSVVVTKKQFVMLVGLLKSNRSKSFDTVVGTRKMLESTTGNEGPSAGEVMGSISEAI